MTDIAQIAAGLSEAQREFLLSLPTQGERVLTEKEWDDKPELFVQFTPDEYCPDTGCLLGGGQMHWFASGHAHSPFGEAGWRCTAKANDTGLAVRAHLAERAE